MSTESAGTSLSLEDIEARLEDLRTDNTQNAIALVAVILVGVGLAWLHWTGLILAGVLLGVISRTLLVAVLNAVLFGLVVLAVFALTEGTQSLGYLEMTPIIYVTLVSAFVLPIYGSLVRGLF